MFTWSLQQILTYTLALIAIGAIGSGPLWIWVCHLPVPDRRPLSDPERAELAALLEQAAAELRTRERP